MQATMPAPSQTNHRCRDGRQRELWTEIRQLQGGHEEVDEVHDHDEQGHGLGGDRDGTLDGNPTASAAA